MKHQANKSLSKPITHILWPVLSALASLIPFTASSQDAQQIVKRADEKMRGNSSVVELTITTVRSTWSRSMDIKAWMKGSDYSMILVQSPARDKGIVFLKRKKEVWNWMPVLERTIKLPPSMMSQSWMGTDFTNDDLVKEASAADDYLHFMLGDTLLEGRPCKKIMMQPKNISLEEHVH